MKLDRKDFIKTDGSRCYRCNIEFTGRTVYIALNNDKEIYFGPECVKKEFPGVYKNISDFTRANKDLKDSSSEITNSINKARENDFKD